jgi:hypothetical protein
MIELNDKSEVLTILYQMLLLREIGVKGEILKWWMFESFHSYPIKVRLAKVGLLDEDAVDAKSAETKSPG